MINDKCSGFALLAVVFMMAVLISSVFLCTYLLCSEPRDDSRQFITDMKERRYMRAFLGRMADQRAGNLMQCGGYLSDYGFKYLSPNRCEESPQLYSRRFVRTGSMSDPDYRAAPYGYAADHGFTFLILFPTSAVHVTTSSFHTYR